ncbi:MAG: long-chain fatty acid--CoA ligase [Betaproteobacteria bacterium]|nr:MAG: long-chain fatty acid--CoA ligase [Betaproteobacteria bacterium]
MSIGSVLLRAAQRWPDAVALVDAASGRRWTFGALAAACAGTGARLRAGGLEAGARVALLADAQPEYLFADYGAMAAGYVRVPLDPALSAAELANQVKDSEAQVLLAGDSRRALAEKIAALVPMRVLPIEESISEPAWEPLAADTLATLNYTGGTSSAPKAVMLTHGNLRAALQNIVMARGAAPGEVMLNVRPLWPIAAVIVLAHLAAGGTVVLAGSFDPARFAAELARWRAGSTSLVPTHLVRLLRETSAPELASLGHLRAIDVGGAGIAPEIFAKALDALGPKIGVLYGLTEASWSCYQSPADLLGADGKVDPARLRSAGRPVFGCDVRIGDGGEVELRGAHVMHGYWKRPELTREVLREGWFRTGDEGRLDAAGFLSITGRIKEVIRSGGKSVQPEEVERALCAHAGVAEAAVVGLPDAEWGEIVAAAVVAAPGAQVTPALLMEHCRAQLSAHKRPKIIRLVETLPRSHYGKVQRAKVKAALTAA